MKLRKQAHTVYKAQYHIVWVTRFRRKVLVKGVKEYLKIKLREVQEYYRDWEIIEIGVAVDHVHLHISFPPKYTGSEVVGTMKKNTSRELMEKFDFLKKVYWDDRGMWSVGYFFSTVGINEEVIQKYVRYQELEDSGQAQLELSM